MADDKVPYHERYKAAPPPDYMRYLTAPFDGYWKRQGKIAREASAVADDGMTRARAGDLSGYLGAFLGPVGWASSPITALFPTDEEVYNARDLPEWAKPAVAGTLGAMAAVAPGPKMKGVAKLADEIPTQGITAYHGSPHTFDKFSMDKIGTGEGAQAYGHGLYFAGHEPVAKGYRDTLSKETLRTANGDVFDPQSLEHMSLRVAANKNGTNLDATIARAKEVLASANDQTRPMAERDLAKLSQLKAVGGVSPNPGSMYQVRLNVKPDELLDWDRPLSEQPEGVRAALKAAGAVGPKHSDWSMTGGKIFESVKTDPTFAADMRASGVKGVRYKDAGSRSAEGGTYNYVIFDDNLVSILKRYAIPFTLGAGGAAIVSGANMPPELAAQMGPEA